MENFDFIGFLEEELQFTNSSCENRWENIELGYYVFFDEEKFMLFDLANHSGWFSKIPTNENDYIVDLLKEMVLV